MGEPAFKRFLNPCYELVPEGDYWLKMKPNKEKTALVLIDLQKGILEFAKTLKEKYDKPYFYEKLTKEVIPNTKRLLEFFRKNKLVVVHTTIGSFRSDGKDRSPVQSRPGWNNVLLKIGTPHQEEIDEIKAVDDEIRLNKTTESALNGTSLGNLLRWMGIEHVIVVGVATDQCVSGTARDLADLGFIVYVVEGATATISKEIHEAELRIINQIYSKVVVTSEILKDLESSIR